MFRVAADLGQPVRAEIRTSREVRAGQLGVISTGGMNTRQFNIVDGM